MIDICGTCHKNFVECECAKEGRGAKFDQGKDRWDLLPFAEVKEIVQVFTLGAKKYADNNWQNVPEGKKRYRAAIFRHLTAWILGERLDKDTGLSHLAHAGCCLLFLMWIDNNKN